MIRLVDQHLNVLNLVACRMEHSGNITHFFQKGLGVIKSDADAAAELAILHSGGRWVEDA